MAGESDAAKERVDRDDADRERDFAVVGRMSAVFADVPFDEIEAEAEKALAEVRAEMAGEARDFASPAATHDGSS